MNKPISKALRETVHQMETSRWRPINIGGVEAPPAKPTLAQRLRGEFPPALTAFFLIKREVWMSKDIPDMVCECCGKTIQHHWTQPPFEGHAVGFHVVCIPEEQFDELGSFIEIN